MLLAWMACKPSPIRLNTLFVSALDPFRVPKIVRHFDWETKFGSLGSGVQATLISGSQEELILGGAMLDKMPS